MHTVYAQILHVKKEEINNKKKGLVGSRKMS